MENSQPSFLIAGLGNPGREYRDNRHNIGFMVVDELARGLPSWKAGKLGGETTQGQIGGGKGRRSEQDRLAPSMIGGAASREAPSG